MGLPAPPLLLRPLPAVRPWPLLPPLPLLLPPLPPTPLSENPPVSLSSDLSETEPLILREPLTDLTNLPRSTLLTLSTERPERSLCTRNQTLNTLHARRPSLRRPKSVFKSSLTKLPNYVERKEWFNVKDELTRYMYETRGAVRGLAVSREQKEAAEAFFQAIEKTNLSASLKKQDQCRAAVQDSMAKLDKFISLI